MPLEKHDLLRELPESKDAIHKLKMTDQHFAKLFETYHDIDHEVHRIEQGVETTSDEYLEEQKKKRLSLKDELYGMIRDYEASMAS
ncbi:YdcH family protein [Marinobacter sp.]|uniref:YdcH family protein n=1 Tax=Marinobacter sp. TaxID=50741 RepID=UPI003A9031A1